MQWLNMGSQFPDQGLNAGCSSQSTRPSGNSSQFFLLTFFAAVVVLGVRVSSRQDSLISRISFWLWKNLCARHNKPKTLTHRILPDSDNKPREGMPPIY